MNYTPPYTLTPKIFKLSQDISRLLGVIDGQKIDQTPIKLRRLQNIRTIQASLSIEGNTLNIDQVTALFEGKRVLGPARDILEAKNALNIYQHLKKLNPFNIKDFLLSHSLLMQNLIEENGKWRAKGVGIFKGTELSHIAPPAKRVPELMESLFAFLKKDLTLTWLIKACIFHYEMEFIHPFSDGNGRMGRLWQQLLLMKEDPVFEYIPVEVLIKENQESYYKTLSQSDKLRSSTPFIEFSLQIILEALEEYIKKVTPLAQDAETRLRYAETKLADKWFSRKEYIELHKNLSTATASRDLLKGVKLNILKKTGDKNKTMYKFL